MAGVSAKNVLLGVTGGIAVYKAAELARMLVKGGHDVKVMMTDSAREFVAPLTFRTLTGNPVATSMWTDTSSPFPHISLSEEADITVVAPATANVIAKISGGIADDLLTTTVLAARGIVMVAPAMNTRMFLNAVTQENIARMKEKGVLVVEPSEGQLACGDEGVGRMAEPSEIVTAVERQIALCSGLERRKVVVTAGPTREYIDPVRFISNPSTGKMGYAVAERAARRGAEVILISGPTDLYCPSGVERVDVCSAAEMATAVKEKMPGADVLVMAAAVADYTPQEVADSKMKKSEGVPELRFVPTEDILNSVAANKGKCVVVGFAAETDHVLENARRKLEEKRLDLIVANEVNCPRSGFGSDTDLAAVIGAAGEEAGLRMMSKVELADMLLDSIAAKLE